MALAEKHVDCADNLIEEICGNISARQQELITPVAVIDTVERVLAEAVTHCPAHSPTALELLDIISAAPIEQQILCKPDGTIQINVYVILNTLTFDTLLDFSDGHHFSAYGLSVSYSAVWQAQHNGLSNLHVTLMAYAAYPADVKALFTTLGFFHQNSIELTNFACTTV